jgi:hypothetical protein
MSKLGTDGSRKGFGRQQGASGSEGRPVAARAYSRTESRDHMTDIPPLGKADLGGPRWERRLVARIREKHLAWTTEKTYRHWARRLVAFSRDSGGGSRRAGAGTKDGPDSPAAQGRGGLPDITPAAQGRGGLPDITPAAQGRGGLPDITPAAQGRGGLPDITPTAQGRGGLPDITPAAQGRGGLPDITPTAQGRGGLPDITPTAQGRGGLPDITPAAQGRGGLPDITPAAQGRGGLPDITGADLQRFLSYLAVKERCAGAT